MHDLHLIEHSRAKLAARAASNAGRSAREDLVALRRSQCERAVLVPLSRVPLQRSASESFPEQAQR